MSEELYKKIFSNNLRYYMNKCDKSQIDIVNDLGYDKSAVSTWFNGSRLPRMDKVDALAKYLGVRRSDLIEEKTISETAEVDQLSKKATELYSLYEQASPEVQSAVELLLRSAQHSPESQPKN